MRKQHRENGSLSSEQMDDIIRRIVEVAHPEQIILFGSAARDEMGPSSDVDLLVVKSNVNRLDLARRIYANMHGAASAVDVIVVTPDDIERYRDNPALVIHPAIKEGDVIYDSPETTTRRSG